MKRLNQVLESL